MTISNPYKIIGDRIKIARQKIGLSQKALGEQIGLDDTKISKIESGERKIDWVEAQFLVRCLGIGYQDLEV